MAGPDTHKPLKSLRQAREDLVSIYRMLPKVDGNGYSECPIAEDIYAEKQKRQQQMLLHLEQLRKQQQELLERVRKTKNTIIVLDDDKASIHSQSPYEKYEQAQVKQQNHLKILQNKLADLQLKINDLEILLGITSQKQWPFRDPVEGNCFKNYSPAIINKSSAKQGVLSAAEGFDKKKVDSVFKKESKKGSANIANTGNTNLKNGKAR